MKKEKMSSNTTKADIQEIIIYKLKAGEKRHFQPLPQVCPVIRASIYCDLLFETHRTMQTVATAPIPKISQLNGSGEYNNNKIIKVTHINHFFQGNPFSADYYYYVTRKHPEVSEPMPVLENSEMGTYVKISLTIKNFADLHINIPKIKRTLRSGYTPNAL